VARYEKFWPYYCLPYQFLTISTLSGRFDHCASKNPSKCKLAKNGPHRHHIPCWSELCLFVVTFITAHVILLIFVELILNWLHMSFDDKNLQTLHYTAFNGTVWPHLVNGVHVWSRIWSMIDLVLYEAEVRNLGLWYQVMAGMALWRKIEHIWPKVA